MYVADVQNIVVSCIVPQLQGVQVRNKHVALDKATVPLFITQGKRMAHLCLCSSCCFSAAPV